MCVLVCDKDRNQSSENLKIRFSYIFSLNYHKKLVVSDMIRYYHKGMNCRSRRSEVSAEYLFGQNVNTISRKHLRRSPFVVKEQCENPKAYLVPCQIS